jgi:ABC-type lipoprotein release transport system permease subunit
MWTYYIQTGWRDTRRASRTLLANVFIVAGIGLPVLLLLGLQKGLVQQFRSDLQKSPTARMIQATAIAGERFGRKLERQLEDSGRDIDLVIPEILVPAATLERAAPAPRSVRLTLSTTKPGDPLLKFYDLDILKRGEHAVIVSKAVADALGLKYHPVKDRLAMDGAPEVTLRVTRVGDEPVPGRPPGQTMTLVVRGVFEPGGSSTNSTAYLDRDLMDQIQDYKLGRSVTALGWPGSKLPAEVYYDGYLAFTETPYDATDLDRLHGQGFAARELKPDGPPGDREMRQLKGLLKPHTLHVYHIRTGRGNEPVKRDPNEIKVITPRDDIVLAWTPPTVRTINKVPHTVLGLTVNALWLKAYFLNPATRLTSEPTEFQALWPLGLPQEMGEGPYQLNLGKGVEIPLARVPLNPVPIPAETGPEGSSPTPPLVVIPGDLAAHLADLDRGRLIFDRIQSIFALAPMENVYNEARVYATTLDTVPEVDDYLKKELHYNTTSSKTRVQEMRKYSETLDALVWTVLAAVLVFGTFTILFVFGDVTSRKRGAIGIMRIMGMPPTGIFGIVLVRALIVGLAGFVLTVLAGKGLAEVLALQYGDICIIEWEHVQQVLIVALLCCLIGVITPAWRAACLDPVDAITQARTQ